MVAFMDGMRSIDELVADRLRSAHEGRKATYDKKRLEPHHYRVNDRCWVKKPPSSPKEQPRFHGPCKIVAIEGPATYRVEVGPGSHRLCAADQLKLYYAPLIGRPCPLHYTKHDQSTDPSNPDEWICEKIVGFCPQDPKKKDGVPQLKAHWEGFSKAHDSWEPALSFFTKLPPRLGGILSS